MPQQEHLSALKERLKVVPQLPGVYMFKNMNGDVIYVGKARILRNRLRSYFQDEERLDPKVRAMMMKVRDFDYVVTSGEVEALILECNMIKAYHPHYNIFFRDDKSYPYLKITLHEDFPRVIITREKMHDESRYFGPYADTGALRETVRLLTGLFPLRTCKDFKIGKRPCLNRDIGNCLAPCTGAVDKADYLSMVGQVVSFMEGNTRELVMEMEKEMRKASENLEFELAARLRDSLAAIKRVSEQQKVVSATQLENDLVVIIGRAAERLALVFRIRSGKLVAKDTFWLNISLGQEEPDIMAFFLQQYYSENPDIPAEILVSENPADAAVIEAWLGGLRNDKSGKVSIKVPQRGEKKNLLDMARENAVLLWEERLRRSTTGQEILADLARVLNLPVVPERIECYDISHLGGEETVGSMVVFTGAEKDSKAYRRFKVSVGNNDFQSLAEVLERRLKAGMNGEPAFLPMPDILMMDGGLGQVNSAAQVIDKLGVDIPLISLAKKQEEIFRPGNSQSLKLSRNSEVLKLLQRIRDEAHRFAIGHNRQRIRKRSLTSILDTINGVGEKRRQALMKHYGSIEGIKKATIEELAAVPGMNSKSAQAVYNFFHGERNVT
ncbi:MAG: excinuclease ABC subunit UvrC [Candidatus Saccharibacteria bacterium]